MATPTTQDDFQQWVFDMDDALDDFRQRVPADQRDKLDYSPASLDVAEKWILDTYPSVDAMLKPDQAQQVDGVARYIGETFRKALGGSWRINLEDPKQAFHGMPVVVFGSNLGEDSPQSLATATADRRTGTYLRQILEYKLEDKAAAEGK